MNIQRKGLDILEAINISNASPYNLIRDELLNISSKTGGNLEEKQAWLVCTLALHAASSGNFGVGAALFDSEANLIDCSENKVFNPNFRSDGHAEMMLLSKIEQNSTTRLDLSKCTLVSSLESCPMCLSRIIISQVGQVVHIADDIEGGMVHSIPNLPPIWVQLQKTITFRNSTCSEMLKKIAGDIFTISAGKLNQLLVSGGGMS